ncbi:MAG TPA: family 20 glycosylhydrolase [Bacillota bacterium]|nr:family 20 glycosylhydrolase [Bacillota bacterium]HPF42128.1 family 20 glycosylhydrolase [Bacillota bacterium]HPJ85345.1 family 20 glycosylhydrolase [Bacillota bacterium]HPQ61359.1 family 20 glycosylhydrolase [Bacillota bacterium]HRX91407.1 family 20 glycosylhydrolase [Candidatus Izemoplasmatales bacterium]
MEMILPRPKSIEIIEGEYVFPQTTVIACDILTESIGKVASKYLNIENASKEADLEFAYEPGLKDEEYILTIGKKKSQIRYTKYSGALRGLSTYIQLQREGKVRCQRIDDWPDLGIRGFLLDISRDKIPTMKTLKEVIDMLFISKMNHFELYVEGFPVYLKSFPNLPYEDPLTPKEMDELESYCLARGIDFVRNINTFGHMTAWLGLDFFHNMAECEEGYVNYGYPFPASTLNPLDPRSIELVKKMIDDACGNSQSAFFNVNGDEPFELGLGKSKEKCAEKGRGKVYLTYMEKVMNRVREKGKRPIIWGDVFNEDPSLYELVGNDVVVCDWGYDSEHDFETPSIRMEKAGKDFLLAPGTSSWNSFSGRYEDMRDSIRNAAMAAKSHMGLGILLTDWGDYSHPQSLSFSLPSLLFAATASWGEAEDIEKTEKWLDQNVFNDKSNGFADKIIELSKYHMLEDFNIPNGTMTFASWMFVDPDESHPLELKYAIWQDALTKQKISPDNAEKILSLAKRIEDSVFCNEECLVAKEIVQTCRLIEIGVSMNQIANGIKSDKKQTLALIESVMKTYGNVWLERNREPGLKKSLLHLEIIAAFLRNNLLV